MNLHIIIIIILRAYSFYNCFEYSLVLQFTIDNQSSYEYELLIQQL